MWRGKMQERRDATGRRQLEKLKQDKDYSFEAGNKQAEKIKALSMDARPSQVQTSPRYIVLSLERAKLANDPR
jgi:hypothetical protein